MSRDSRIPPAVEYRDCPGCGFVMVQQQIEASRFDFPCPRCGKHTLRDFQPWPRTPEPPKPGKRKAA